MSLLDLNNHNTLFIRQYHEIAEWIGFETRNKYQVKDERGQIVAFAAEQQKGFLGFIFRQFLGHWRTFDIHVFSPDRMLLLVAHHPFRWYFKRIEVADAQGKYLGAIEKRFAIFTKKFDIENANGSVIMQVASPFWRIWTFTFMNQGQVRAEIKKKWSGIFSELLTDKDNFMLSFSDKSLTEAERNVLLCSAIYIDLLYFERKASS